MDRRSMDRTAARYARFTTFFMMGLGGLFCGIGLVLALNYWVLAYASCDSPSGILYWATALVGSLLLDIGLVVHFLLRRKVRELLRPAAALATTAVAERETAVGPRTP